MSLPAAHTGWQLDQISVVNIKFVFLDQLLTKLWLRVLFDNRPLAPRVGGLQAVAELAQLIERANPDFKGFAGTGVAETWLRSDLVKTLKVQKKLGMFSVARPLHDRAVRIRNAREDGDANASRAVYGWLHNCDPELLSELREFLTFDPDGERVDLATFALGLLGDQQIEDMPRPGEPEAVPAPLCRLNGDRYTDDLRRLLAYRLVMPRADLIDHIRRLTGFHLALYLLKVARITVEADESGGLSPSCDSLHGSDEGIPCPYRLELLVDCGEDAQSPIAKLAELSWTGEEAWIARYIRSHLALRKVFEYAEQLKRRDPSKAVPFSTLGEIASIERIADQARLEAYFSQRFDDLVAAVKDGKGGQDDDIRELETEYLALGLSPLRAYVALLAHYSERRWFKFHRDMFDSLFGKNSPEGMFRQPLGGLRRRRLSMAPGMLETLTLISVVRDSPRGYVTRPMMIDELMDRFDRRYGLLIGRPPASLGNDATLGLLLKSNVQRFKARLRETGLYTDLSDAYLAQTVKPRYVIGAAE
jgi:hypothetical protein